MPLLDWILNLAPDQAYLFSLPFAVTALACWADKREQRRAVARSSSVHRPTDD